MAIKGEAMKLTASKTAINVITAYCNKHGIAIKQRNDKMISFEKVTIPLRSYCRGVMQVEEII